MTGQNQPRITVQRKILLEELRKVLSHPTAVELYEMVRKRLPHISLGTVYRNLELMSDMGVIQKLEMAGTRKRFDGNLKNHYHVRCIVCQRVDDLDIEPLSSIDQAVQDTSHYEVIWHKLEFMGICPVCRAGQGGTGGPRADCGSNGVE
jgi:Fur family transcriptional regulator, ferric uptake regulator